MSAAAAAAPGLASFGVLAFAYFTTIGLFNPYAPLWFQSLGFSTVLIGALSALQAFTRLFAPYAWSWWGDHGGRRVELLRLAAAGSLLSALGLLGVHTATAVAAVVALLFLANSGVVPLYEATLAHQLAGEEGIDARRYGRIRVWGSIGFVVSVMACGALLDLAGVGLFPTLVAATNAMMLAAALRLPVLREPARHDEPAPAVLPLLRRPAVAWFFVSIALTVLAHTSQYAFFSLYAKQLGYGKTAIGALWALGVLVEIVFFWKQGRWFRRLDSHRWLWWVGLFTALRFAATAAFGDVPAVLWLAQCTHAITFAAHHTACIDLVQRQFPGRARGRGQALYTSLGYGVPGVLGGVAGGWVVEHAGFAAVFWAAAACGVGAMLAARRAARHFEHPAAATD